MKHIKTLLVFVLLTALMPVFGQTNTAPVRWRAITKTEANGNGVLTIKAIVSPGWHLYALELPDGGPKPTIIDLSQSTGLEFTGKLKPSRAATEVSDPLFGMTLGWWDANVEFTIPYKVKSDNASFKCNISFMTCDGTTCRPPSSETISGPVKIKKQ